MYGTGIAIAAPTGTVHRRSVRAPHATMTAPTATRSHSGPGSVHNGNVTPALSRRLSTHSNQADGMITNETRATAAVAPIAIPSERHSRRTANHSSPTPGVTFVRRMKAHAAGWARIQKKLRG